MGSRADKAKKSVPWVALASAVALPFFGYLESRSSVREAELRAQTAQLEASKNVGKVEDTQGAVYDATSLALGLMTKDIDACHRRVDSLAEAVSKLDKNARRSRSRPVAISEVIQQASVVRPLDYSLPRNKRDVKSGDPLQKVLK